MLNDFTSFESMREGLSSLCSRVFADWHVMDPIEWVETIRRIEVNGSVRSFSFNYAPYQREPFSEAFNPENQELCYMWASRVGKTETCQNVLGYTIHQRPRRIGVMWPTIGLAEKWSKDDLTGTLLDPTPELARLISDGRGKRQSQNTLLHKIFPGGILDIIGANAPGDIRRVRASLLYAPEIDAIQETETDEGDPLARFKFRGSEFPDTCEIYESYPSVRGASRIETKIIESDCREWFVTCPLCGGEPFIMHRTGISPFDDDFKRSRLLFDHDKPELARMECPNCKGQLDDTQRYSMMMGGDPAHPRFDLWKPTKEFRGRRGYHANAFLWPHPFDARRYPGGFLQLCAQGVIDAEKSENPERKLRVLINTMDGETWEPPSSVKPSHSALFQRREDYTPEKMLPPGVLFVVFTCDVQGAALNPKGKEEEGGRLEVEFIGYGLNNQEWGLGHYIINGSPLVPPDTGVWAELDALIERASFPHPSGKVIRVSGGLVDCNWKRDFVCAYTRTRAARRIYASRGGKEVSLPIVQRHPKFEGRPPSMVWVLGVNSAKEIIYRQLACTDPAAVGYMHYPKMPCYSEAYFAGLVSENTKIERGSDGGFYLRFVQVEGARNEPLDLRVMGKAAVKILSPNFERLAEEYAVKDGAAPTVTTPQPPTPARPPRSLVPRLGGTKGYRVHSWR